MEEQNESGNSEYKLQKYIWFKFLLISSIIFIPIIWIGSVRTKAGCYGQGFACFPSPELIIGFLGYGLSILTSITMGIVEFAKSRAHNAKFATQENASLSRIYAFTVFFSLYRFVIHLETVIDYSRDGFRWEGKVLSLPFEIAILITLSIFIFRIVSNWNNFIINTSKSLLYSCIFLIMINVTLSLIEVILIYNIVF